MTAPSCSGSRLSGKRNVLNFTRGPPAGGRGTRRAPLAEQAIDFSGRGEVDARVTERNPMKTLAEQGPSLRRSTVVVARQRSVLFLTGPDMAEITAFRC